MFNGKSLLDYIDLFSSNKHYRRKHKTLDYEK